MNERQRVAWLVAVGLQSMGDRGVDVIDGEAIEAILAVAGSEHASEAAQAIQQLTGAA